MGTYITRPSRVKRLIREGKVALGTYAMMADPAQVELAGLGGYDAVSLHWEYTSIDFNMLENMIRAAEVVDTDFIVRIPELNASLIKRVLDMGAHGLWLPHDGRGVEGVKQAIDAMRYPPQGHRTASLRVRATGYHTLSWEEHLRRQEDIILIVPIEDRKAIAEVEEIAALDGVDLLMVGVFDVAEALGVPWTDAATVMAKWEEIAAKVKRQGKKMLICYDGTHMKIEPRDLTRLNAGYVHVVPPATTMLLRQYQAKSKEIRDGLGYSTETVGSPRGPLDGTYAPTT